MDQGGQIQELNYIMPEVQELKSVDERVGAQPVDGNGVKSDQIQISLNPQIVQGIPLQLTDPNAIQPKQPLQ